MALNAKISTYDVGNALALAQASQLAYQDSGAIRAGIAAITGGTLRDFKFLNSTETDTQAFMAAFDDAVLLCFRGTQNRLADWLSDTNVVLVPFRRIGLVHKGFRDALDSVYPDIEATLKQWSGQGRTLWITGHSLGGALALMAAAYLRFPADPTKTVPRPIAGLYTYGQPRVGTPDFCDVSQANFGSSYFRFVNKDDIVTRVPPRELAYWHGGHDRYINHQGVIQEDPVWWQIVLDRVKAGIGALRQLQVTRPVTDLIADHAIADYIKAIGGK